MLSADHRTGGHVHDFVADRLEVTASRCRSVHLEVPDEAHHAAAGSA
jgi:alpha-acetolactate decarboxylase